MRSVCPLLSTRFGGSLSLCMLLVLMLSTLPLAAQQVENVDEAFEHARELAFSEEYEEARRLCEAILEVAPDYHDVRILMARTYSWQGRYDEAARELARVLERAPRYRDAHVARIDNELWAGRHEEALEAASRATRFHATDEELLLRLATAYHYLEKDRQALQVLDRVEAINPSSPGVETLRRRIDTGRQNNSLSVSYTHDRFSRTFEPWNTGYLQFGRSTPAGTLLGRLNFASRFAGQAVQPEIDFYPLIADGWYGYLNLGYADHFLFPELRLGAELYHRLFRTMEFSAGFRHLSFPGNPVTMYTGSVTKYAGNWMLTARPYFTPGSEGVSHALQLQVRRYLADSDNYLTLRGGFGFSPELRTFQDVPGDSFTLYSRYAGLEFQRGLLHNLFLFAYFDLIRQELLASPGDYMTRYTLNSGLNWRF